MVMMEMVLVAMVMTTSDSSHDHGGNNVDSDKYGSADEKGDIYWLAMTTIVTSFQGI